MYVLNLDGKNSSQSCVWKKVSNNIFYPPSPEGESIPGHVSTPVCVPSDLLKQDGQVEATDGLYAVTSGGGGGV
jgi:hypothetical protein